MREPEVWSRAGRWPASEYYDGRLLTGAEAVVLSKTMLAGAEFWCRLVTDIIEVHVAEEAIYVGTAEPELGNLLSLVAERVDSSPYVIDRRNFPYYMPADETFWSELRRGLSSGMQEMLILQQWAAGPAGERWYRVVSTGDLETVRRNVIPRAVYAVFRSPGLVRRREALNQPASTVVAEEALLANVRIFHDLSESPLMVDNVANEAELEHIWGSLDDRGALFLWTDDAVVSYAAQPDADGQVRAAVSFQ
ncbi:hypothetical protein [Kribbella sp. ALI-6-A]|uniref:hypothetical protein n=1 Tax=Kribbella sp. ALI-6-A TaxID=1933817 RepID=UPI0011798AE8|nr:hypothetical protein [Kribbella sp. ALI-6-A]